jgi:hypothetical protein
LSIRSKILATAAALALIGGVGTAGVLGTTVTANAATPSCGGSCVDPFSFQFGTHKAPNYVLDVFQQKRAIGTPIILFRSSNNDPAEDFKATFQGSVSDFYNAGLVGAAVDLHYGGSCVNETVTTPVLAPPAAPTVVGSHTGGHVAAGTYYIEVTYVNASGETTASPPTTVVTTGTTSTITISPPAAEGNATGWYAYVATSITGPYYRQQALGSPTAIGSNLVLTATPTAVLGTNPPAVNTATTAPVQSCGGYYPDLYAWELEYAPDGVLSGLCVGLASTAVSGEGVTLQDCGVSSRTVWITDTVNAAGWHDNYVPVINGSDSNFSQPFVLDYPQNGFPTDKPRPQLVVNNLTGYTNGSILDQTGIVDTQLWGGDFGPLP